MDNLVSSFDPATQSSGGVADGAFPLPGLGRLRVPARSERSERKLIREAKRGSKQAFEALFRIHWPRVHRTSYLIVRDAAAAEDIAQESFVAALRHLGSFDARRPLGPWLNRIVVNRSIDWTRTRRLRAEVQADPGGEGRTAADHERLLGAAPEEPEAEVSDELMTALAQLSAERRAVVVMRYLLDYTPSEIAESLDLPTGTVNSRLRRALDQLGVAYEERADA